MKNNYKIISIILARGGSKGLPGKNIRILGDKPLISYTIKASLQSRFIDNTIVSTDSDEIKKISIDYGAEVPFIRPAKLSSDTAHSPDAVLHAVKYYEEKNNIKFDIIIMLQPTSPFRTGKHIDEAINNFLKEESLDSLISIKKQDYPPWWMFSLENSRLKKVFEYKKNVNVFNLERQQLPTLYRPNGAIYITWRNYLYKYRNIVNPDNNGYYLMESDDSIDIDNLSDFFVAESLLKK